MDRKKLIKQLAVIGLVIVLFAGSDIGIYQLFIKRVISHHSEGMLKMSVEVGNYVPFTGSEHIVSVDGVERLEGDIPTIDGAAGLLPMYAGFVESIYPEDSVLSLQKSSLLMRPKTALNSRWSRSEKTHSYLSSTGIIRYQISALTR